MTLEDLDNFTQVKWVTFSMSFLSLKALIVIHLNCMERATSTFFQMFHLFFHIEKKEVTQVWSNMKVSTVNDETIHLWVHYPLNSQLSTI